MSLGPDWRRRRVVVIGPAWFRRLVAREAPSDVDIVAAIGLADVGEVCSMRWDETVVESQSWQGLRERRPDVFLRAPVIALPSADPSEAATFLRRPFGTLAAGVKRGSDVVLALLLGALALPIIVLSCAAILLETGRPVLFKQPRAGVGGVRFTLYKLRTMVKDADELDAEHAVYFTAVVRGVAPRNDGLFKLVDDVRITRVGRLLRRLSIDELPQLWNVLRGEMSIIGPRPMMLSEIDLLSVEQWARLRVRPGLTGAWQVAGRSALSFDEMVRLDIEYWQQWKPTTDLRVLLLTPGAVLHTSGTA